LSKTAPLHCIVLAAGKGTRMKSEQPKVLQPLAGRPLLAHVLDASLRLAPAAIHVVYGHGAEQVRSWGGSAFADAPLNWVLQAQQNGTAHAVQQAMPAVPDDATVLVLYGDVPLTPPETLATLVQAGRRGLALLTVELDDPSGYGRILRDRARNVKGIVEHKDAKPAQRRIREVNTGLMAMPAKRLRRWLDKVGNDNASGEFYLTDIVALAVRDKLKVTAVSAVCAADVAGVNDKLQLAGLERELQRRQADALMRAGVTLADPARFDLRGELVCGTDVSIDVGCVFEGQVELGDRVQIGPHCVLRNVRLGAGTRVDAHSVLEACEAGAEVRIGPFARLRPGAQLADDVHIGNFVEVKNTTLGRGSKANHLAYLGDGSVGSGVNIGAGTIFCNYDGANKHRTTIGDDAFIGSDTQLVAPVKVGKGATIAAGSTITKDVPAGGLTLCRAREQKTYASWQRPQKKDKR
jgi:bifunctional UDP-N-acetylglucosamine pyrophosphorylase/glucosamine-1-phosphate N-acetyltransferase